MAKFFKNPPPQSTYYHSQLFKQRTAIPTTALGALKFYESKVKEFLEDRKPVKDSDWKIDISSTTTGIMKLARARLLEMNSKGSDVFSIISICFGDIDGDEFEDLEIAITLQAAAEKVAYKKFSSAKKLLTFCCHLAFKTGNPVQRTVYYFAKALEERIDRESGFCLERKTSCLIKPPIDVIQTQISLNPATIAHHQQFNVVAINQFTAIQSILENVASVRKIHLIDFRIRNGCQWTILMQALAVGRNVPVELVKITAVGTNKEMMEQTGKRLSLFAESMEIPFSFHLIVSELQYIKKDMFKIEPDETVSIFSSVCLFSLIPFPSQLDSLMQIIKNLKPCVLVVNEVNQSINSPNFIETFTKSLLFISALFDCVSVCDGKGSYRKFAEEVHIWEVIKDIVVDEGIDRVFTYENLSFWRALLSKFGFVETQISSIALSQAKLMVECSSGKNSYNIGMDGKCMTLGWKGTPIEFLSVWRFNDLDMFLNL